MHLFFSIPDKFWFGVEKFQSERPFLPFPDHFWNTETGWKETCRGFVSFCGHQVLSLANAGLWVVTPGAKGTSWPLPGVFWVLLSCRCPRCCCGDAEGIWVPCSVRWVLEPPFPSVQTGGSIAVFSWLLTAPLPNGVFLFSFSVLWAVKQSVTEL